MCWAVIGTTTSCSRAVQMWVTSNIVEPAQCAPHHHAAADALKRRSTRRWDWNAVLRACALPAGVVYFVMAWMLVLRRELGGC